MAKEAQTPTISHIHSHVLPINSPSHPMTTIPQPLQSASREIHHLRSNAVRKAIVPCGSISPRGAELHSAESHLTYPESTHPMLYDSINLTPANPLYYTYPIDPTTQKPRKKKKKKKKEVVCVEASLLQTRPSFRSVFVGDLWSDGADGLCR